MSQSNLQTEVTSATADKWPVKVHAAGRGQWGFVAGPRSGTGYQSKQAALEAGEAARLAAIARASARTSDQARARWAAEYREARKVRRFWDAFPSASGHLSLVDSVGYSAFRSAGRACGEVSNVDTLTFSTRSRLLWFQRGCRMPVTGPARRLPA